MTLDSAKTLVENYTQRVWNEKDISAIDEIIDENCIVHSLLGDYKTRAYMKQVVSAWLIAFPDMHVKNYSLIAENDLVAVQWIVNATHKGEFKGIKPTNRPISYSGATFYRIKNNTVTEYWAHINMQHILQQIS